MPCFGYPCLNSLSLVPVSVLYLVKLAIRGPQKGADWIALEPGKTLILTPASSEGVRGGCGGL